jgi:hypothetical protein
MPAVNAPNTPGFSRMPLGVVYYREKGIFAGLKKTPHERCFDPIPS